MKNIFKTSFLLLALAFIGLSPVLASNSVHTLQPKFFQEDRNMKNFNGVAAGGPINVIITLGNTEGVRFEGDADAIATLITEVRGNILIIRPQNSWTSWARKYEHKTITAYVNAKILKSLTMSGNGAMSVIGKINTSSLVATLSGSGSISASAVTDNFSGIISGSGNLNFSGNTNVANITISGSGNFTKKGFAVNELSAVVSGSGSVYVHANDHINAVVSGSGSINYSGNASVDQRVSGSGRVRKI